jgi:hypothetical protein
MSFNQILGFIVGSAIAGFIYYQIQVKQVGTANGKFLGLKTDDNAYGPDDIAKGAVMLGGAALAIKLAHQIGLPATTSPL